jgi:hypothetical protein
MATLATFVRQMTGLGPLFGAIHSREYANRPALGLVGRPAERRRWFDIAEIP